MDCFTFWRLFLQACTSALPAALVSLWLILYGAGIMWHAVRWLRGRQQ